MNIANVAIPKPASDRAFWLSSALIFALSLTVTVVWSGSMSAMSALPMPGGWAMSMVWMRMPGQSWSGVAASFAGMWLVMMMAMMLPSLAPTLVRYRQAVREVDIPRLGLRTTLDLRAMALVTAALAAERLTPAGERVARVTGVIVIGIGLFLVTRAVGIE